jgi:pantoate--beta-alanine ligase
MIQVWRTVDEWTARRRALEGRSIGFVPTMGALHTGHGSLVERCRRDNEVVIVSIFVNPTQFNDPGDLQRYPRTFENDLALIENLGADELIMPDPVDLYPNGDRFRIESETDTRLMEGAHRPGFLQGVMTVVLKLLNLVRADRAYFGEKDFQQLQMVTDMAREFFVPTEIVPCATVREKSGLAVSSRNTLLSADGKRKAAALFGALTHASTPPEARAMLEAQGFVVDYVEEHAGRRFAAAFLEGVRLIDNTAI